MYPHNTEMDLSIASALYFAARGEGTATTKPGEETRPYATTARVLMSGLGADELFGGYSRHGAAHASRGYQGLVDELKLDVGRLGKRNLGRDDRVMAHWGREVRFPFLDEALVRWAMALPAWEKCDFGNTDSGATGLDAEKRVLRLLSLNLGMAEVAREKKRAVSPLAFLIFLFFLAADVVKDSVRRPDGQDGERQGQGNNADNRLEQSDTKQNRASAPWGKKGDSEREGEREKWR